ncbi:MAG: hypothetical protein ACW99L_17475 [Promethearchaeota archaeon]
MILDLPEVPFFYPFINYDFVTIEDPLFYWFTTIFTNPLVLLTEITGIGILTYIFIANRLYHRSKFVKYLTGNPRTSVIVEK